MRLSPPKMANLPLQGYWAIQLEAILRGKRQAIWRIRGIFGKHEVFLGKFAKVDLVKIDVEGHEAQIICSTDAEDWIDVDAIAEIGSEQNARKYSNTVSN